MLAPALFLWELPQNLLGLANLALQRAIGNVRRVERARGCLMIELGGEGGVSLGRFVFHGTRDSRYVPLGPENADHEYGHSIQSRWLGPLYLALVGVPSVSRVVYARLYHARHGRRWARYYDGWPEDSADRLGGVDRALRPPP
jgi:hypothetical protein